MSKNGRKSGNDSTPDIWDKLWDGKDIEKYVLHMKKNSIDSLIKIHFPFVQNELRKLEKGSFVLEAGCGMGQWVFYTEKVGHQSIGLDFSRTSLKKARKYASSKNSSSEFVLGDIRKAPLKENSIDYLLSFGVIEHFYNPRPLLKEFRKILKLNGSMLITVPNKFSSHTLERPFLKLLGKWVFGYETSYSPKSLKYLVETCGFKVKEFGILPSGEIFGTFPRRIPLIGNYIYAALVRIGLFVERKIRIFGCWAYAIARKNNSPLINSDVIIVYSSLLAGTSITPSPEDFRASFTMDGFDYSLNRYCKEHSLKVEKIFFVDRDKTVRYKIDDLLFTFYPIKRRNMLMKDLFRKVKRICIFHMNDISIISLILASLMKIFGVKIVYFLHNVINFDSINFFKRIFFRAFLNIFPNAILIYTRYQKKQISNLTSRPIYVFPSGVNINKFKQQLPTKKSNDRFVVLFVGRMAPSKEIETIIKGISFIERNENREKVELWLVGGIQPGCEQYYKFLKTSLRDSDISHRFFGFVPYSKLPRYFSEADVFVNMRSHEAFGKVFVEAMSVGVPVIGRKGSPGPEEIIIDGKNGYKVKDEVELSEVLSELIEDRSKLDSMKPFCRDFVNRRYNFQESYRTLKRVYDEVLKDSSK